MQEILCVWVAVWFCLRLRCFKAFDNHRAVWCVGGTLRVWDRNTQNKTSAHKNNTSTSAAHCGYWYLTAVLQGVLFLEAVLNVIANPRLNILTSLRSSRIWTEPESDSWRLRTRYVLLLSVIWKDLLWSRKGSRVIEREWQQWQQNDSTFKTSYIY